MEAGVCLPPGSYTWDLEHLCPLVGQKQVCLAPSPQVPTPAAEAAVAPGGRGPLDLSFCEVTPSASPTARLGLFPALISAPEPLALTQAPGFQVKGAVSCYQRRSVSFVVAGTDSVCFCVCVFDIHCYFILLVPTFFFLTFFL